MHLVGQVGETNVTSEFLAHDSDLHSFLAKTVWSYTHVPNEYLRQMRALRSFVLVIAGTCVSDLEAMMAAVHRDD